MIRFNRTADLHFNQNSLVHILGNYVDYMHSGVHIFLKITSNMYIDTIKIEKAA